MAYTLFVPTTYDPEKPAPLVVNLHGYDITPLQQMLFDGTTDFAERYGFIVVAPMGYSVTGGWGMRLGPAPGSGDTGPVNSKYFGWAALRDRRDERAEAHSREVRDR